MAYVATQLNVPNFLFSRNRIKKDQFNHEHLRKHIEKNRQLLAKKCILPKQEKKILYRTDRIPCKINIATSVKRDLLTNKPWAMPPNLYDVMDEPYARQKGLKGAYWEKLHTKIPAPPHESRSNVRTIDCESKASEKAYNLCNKYKGYFNSNARNRRPTSRFMVSDLTTCWRDPNEPGPLDYCADNKKKKISGIMRETPLPYKFILHTCVPEKETATHMKNIHFLPGPGRFETYFRNACATCTIKRYSPFITQEIEKQKRLKFRRLPYKKINYQKYCDPQFAHIPGKGFPHLFKKPIKKSEEEDKPLPKDRNQKVTKDLLLYADAKYMNIINNPDRKSFIKATSSMKKKPVKIFYNTLAKRIKRRHLQSNKKIAFMSGQTRWKDAERPPPMTMSQLENIKLKLPAERRLYDHAITMTPIEELTSRIREIPPHMQPAYKIEMKKKLYKFKSLPEPKVLVTEDDIRAFYENGKYVGRRLFFQPINPENFYKNEDDRKASKMTEATKSSIVGHPDDF